MRDRLIKMLLLLEDDDMEIREREDIEKREKVIEIRVPYSSLAKEELILADILKKMNIK